VDHIARSHGRGRNQFQFATSCRRRVEKRRLRKSIRDKAIGIATFCTRPWLCFRRGMSGSASSQEAEEILTCGDRPDAGALASHLFSLCLESVRASHSQMRQCCRPAVPHDPTRVADFLKLRCGSNALSVCPVCLAAYKRRIQAGNIGGERAFPLTRWAGQLARHPGPKPESFCPTPIALHRGQAKRLHLRVFSWLFPVCDIGRFFLPTRYAQNASKWAHDFRSMLSMPLEPAIEEERPVKIIARANRRRRFSRR
jgi:hypothetical protein